MVSLQKYFQSFSFHFYCTYLACATWYCDILVNWLLSAKKLTKQSFLFVTLLWLPMIRPYLQLIANSQHEIAHHYYILNAVSYTWRLTHLPFLQLCSFDPHFPLHQTHTLSLESVFLFAYVHNDHYSPFNKVETLPLRWIWSIPWMK